MIAFAGWGPWMAGTAAGIALARTIKQQKPEVP